jgi:hypothetical protein
MTGRRFFAALRMTERALRMTLSYSVAVPATAKLRSVGGFFELFVEHTQLYVDGTECPIDIV